MKKLLFIVLMLTSIASFAQPQFGGQVGGYDNSGTKKFLMFNGNAAKHWDSSLNVTSAAMKLKLDSLYSKINSTISVTQSGTWNITNVSGTISLPTGAATSTNQSTHNTLLQGIKTIDSSMYTSMYSIDGEAEHGGVVMFGKDVNDGDIHPFSAKTDNNLAIEEYGIPMAVWNVDSNEYNFLQTDGNFNLRVNDQKSNTLLQSIRTADSSIAGIVSYTGEGEHGGIVSYGMDFANGEIHPFSAKQDNNLLDGEYGIPIALWNGDNGEYDFMQMDGNYNVKVNDQKGNTLLQGIKTLDSIIYNKLNDSIRVFATNGFGSGGGGGAGTEYAEGTTTSPATGTSALFRYNATQPTLADGAMSMPQVDVNGKTKVCLPSRTATGNITTQNLVPAGVATANSAVEIDMQGYTSCVVQITGTYTGAMSLQGTVNGTTWVTSASNTIWNMANSSALTVIASATQGIFRIGYVPYSKIRITGLAAVTGTATVTIIATQQQASINVENSVSTSTSVTGVTSGILTQAEDAVAGTGAGGNFELNVRRDDLTISASGTGDYTESTSTKFGGRYVKDEERQKLSYVVSTAGINMPASCTDIFTLTPNSVAKQINITKVTIWGTASTATLADILFLKRSTVNSAGTTETIMDMNEGDVNSNSRAYSYATVPTTLGTAITGNIKLFPAMFNLTSVAPEKYEFNFGELGKPLILRASTGESFCVNMGTATIPGGRFYISVEFTEE